MNPIQQFIQDTVRDRRRLALTIGAVAVVVAAGFGAYRVLRPTDRGVLPLGAQDFVQGEFLVKFKPGTAADDRRAAHAASRAEEILENKAMLDKIGVAHMKVPPGSSVGEMVQVYSRNPNIQFAEPNFLRQVIDAPNDQYFPNQWNLAKLMMNQAWDIHKGAPAVTIAVLDTGIDKVHEELAGRFSGSPVADDHGHGTQVAGVAGAATANAKGVAGICQLCTIASYKVLSSTGSGSDSGIAAAIIQAADAGARVINLSLGSYATTQTMQDAIAYAWGKNVVIAAGAGNDNTSNKFYPAALTNVLAVGATDSSDAKSAISNFGDWVTLVAPGQNVIAPKRGGGYGAVAGTSFASPHVAGLAGLIISANPSLTNQQVVNFIVGNVDDLGTPGKDNTFGAGRINGCKALKAATGNASVTCGAASTTTQAVATATPATAATATATSAPATATATSAPATATPAAATATATPAPATATSVPATATPAATEPTATSVPATATPVPPTATATPVPPAKTATFTGSVAATGTAQREHVIEVSGPGAISASLGGWGGNPRNNNLDLFLLNSSGTQLAAAATADRPENLNFNVGGAGSYTLRVVARAGSGNYTLTVTYP